MLHAVTTTENGGVVGRFATFFMSDHFLFYTWISSRQKLFFKLLAFGSELALDEVMLSDIGHQILYFIHLYWYLLFFFLLVYFLSYLLQLLLFQKSIGLNFLPVTISDKLNFFFFVMNHKIFCIIYFGPNILSSTFINRTFQLKTFSTFDSNRWKVIVSFCLLC